MSIISQTSLSGGIAQPIAIVNTSNEVNAVVMNSTITVTSYTVPSPKVGILQKVDVSGENIARYDVLINSSRIDTKRTYFGGTLNEVFDFKTDLTSPSQSGWMLNSGDVVTITVLHTRPNVSTHEARIQVVEIG